MVCCLAMKREICLQNILVRKIHIRANVPAKKRNEQLYLVISLPLAVYFMKVGLFV